MALVVTPVNRWYCPNCGKEDGTHEPRPHSRFHVCHALRGLTAPMLPMGTKAKVELTEWQDYVGKEKVELDPERHRPVQSVVTTRDEGQDAIVFAPQPPMEGGTG